MLIFAIFFHPSITFTALGGAEKRFLYVLDRWLRMGVNIIVVDSQPGLLAKYCKTPSCQIINLPGLLGSRAKNLFLMYLDWFLWLLKAAFLCTLLIKHENCDIILSPNNVLPSLAIAVLLRFISHKPLCVVVHHLDFIHAGSRASFWQICHGYRKTQFNRFFALLKTIFTLATLFLLKYADVYIAVSKTTAELLVINGIPRNKVHISGNAVDIQYIDNVEGGEKIYDGIFVGRISRDKGIFDLIQSWKEISKTIKGPKLVIIGSGPDSHELEYKIRVSGLEENIFFKGPCSDEELFRFMKSSKILILPSMFEGWGMTIAEALACGLPVVCYNIPAIREIFGACKSVFLVPAKDVDKLTATILKVMNMNTEELAKISKEYVKKFSWDEIALKDLKIIERVVIENFSLRSLSQGR